MKKILFHVGDMKTGSTSIQQALASKAWRCSEKTLDYVVAPGQPYHHGLAMAFNPKESHALDAEMQGLAERIARSSADVVVMSTELFEEVPPEYLQLAIREYMPQYEDQIEYLIYTRPHVDRYLSSYSQVIKLGYFIGTLDEYFEDALADRRFFHAERYLRWREVFGDAVTVRAMLRPELHKQDVVQDFFNHAFEGSPFQIVDMPRTNESLSLSDMAVLRDFHRHLKIDHRWAQGPMLSARMRVGERLSEMLVRRPIPGGVTRLALHRDLMERIDQTYEPDAARLDKVFFEDRPLFRDAMQAAWKKTIEEPQSLELCDYYDADMALQTRFWADLIGDMVKQAPKQWDPFFLSILNRDMSGLAESEDAPQSVGQGA